MPNQPSWKTSQGLYKPKTVQHTYRFNAKTWAEFEADCNLNLRSVRVVIEALVRYWLDAGPETREAIARHHRRRTATDTHPNRDDSPPMTAAVSPAARLQADDTELFQDADLLDV